MLKTYKDWFANKNIAILTLLLFVLCWVTDGFVGAIVRVGAYSLIAPHVLNAIKARVE